MDKLTPEEVISQQTASPEYPEPAPLTPDVNKPTPYPVDALPTILSDAVKAIAEKIKAPVAMVGQTVMGATVYLASTRADAEDALGQAMPLNTGFITLGDSGDRKSAVHKQAFLPVHLKEEELVKGFNREVKKHAEEEQGLSGKELKAFKKQNPPPPDTTTLYSDATFEPIAGDLIRGKPIAFIDSDEGGQFFGGHSLKADTRAATIGGYIQLLDSGKVSRKRSKGNEEGSGTAFNRRLSIHLMAQAITIKDALNDPLLRGQGFLPRFFFTAPDSLKETRTLTREEYDRQRQGGNDDVRLKRYWARVSEILAAPEFIDAETGDVEPPVIPMTNDAHNAWLEFYNATERQSGRFGELGEISAFVSRVGDQARKLATSIAVFQRLEQVTGDCMKSAIALTQHSINEWLRYTKAAAVSPAIQDAIDVFEWLTLPTHKTPWHRFDANRFGKSGLNRFRSAQKRNLVLGTLLAHHYLINEGGNNYAINPKLLRTGQGAESAENADNQTGQGLAIAEVVRKSAEKCGSVEEAVKQSAGNPQVSATIRNPSATTNPDEPCLSAKSATSATIEQGNLSAILNDEVELQPLAATSDKQAWTGAI